MNGQAPPVLEVTALAKRYGDQPALREVSFEVRDGEVLGLIGPNGAGKTTLLNRSWSLPVIPADGGAPPAQRVARRSSSRWHPATGDHSVGGGRVLRRYLMAPR
jgi:ABC-type phosphonate transport system ATPase subunit